jgi:hypothetical protein
MNKKKEERTGKREWRRRAAKRWKVVEKEE